MNFEEAMCRTFPEKADELLRLAGEAPTQGFFINRKKGSAEEILSLCDFPRKEYPYSTDLFYHDCANIGKTKAFELGLIYSQEPSAGMPVTLIDPDVSLAIDLCAAPGGKSCGLLSRISPGARLIANDVNYSRAQILSSNLERLGFSNAAVTSLPTAKIAEKLEGKADLVIVDAPCSGEGMVRKYPEIREEYNDNNIRLNAERQKAVLEDAYRCLIPGGQLLYSTCTFAEEEDERQVLGLMSRHPDMRLVTPDRPDLPVKDGMIKLTFLEGSEGQFMALLRKDGVKTRPVLPKKHSVKEKLIDDFLKKETDLKDYYLYREKDRFFLSLQEENEYGLPCLRYGIDLGELKKGRYEPSHAFYRANALKGRYRNVYPLNDEEYRQFIQGLEIDCPLQGYTAVSYHDFALGFGKAGGGKLKNKYPKGLRRVV